jgi:RecB family endonuclease NucS
MSPSIIPFKISSGIVPDEAEELSFKDLQLKEEDLEEFVRKHIDRILPEDETLLIVGRQVRNMAAARSDLVAVDGEGNLVLIELKRDKADMAARKEPF